MGISIILALMAAIGVFLLFWSIKSTIESQETFEERFDALTGRRATQEIEAVGADGSLTAGQAFAGAVERAFVQQGYGEKVRESLSRADVKLTVGEFMIMRAFGVMIGGAVGWVAGATNSLIEGFPLPFMVAGGILGYFVPRIWASRRASKRLNAFNQQLADTIALLSNALRSGNSIAQAMSLASREAPQPTSQEFGRVVAEISLGIPPEEALANLVRRVPSEDLDMMITAMNVSAQVGGNLAEVLDKIGETIRQRVRLKGDIETLTAQQQGAGYIVSILPALIGLVMFLLNGAYMKPMFAGFPYLCMPMCAGLMIFIGFLAMKKITDIKVQETAMLIALLVALMAGAGVFLIFYALAHPPQEESLATRMSQYSAKPISLLEIELQTPFSERMLKPLVQRLSASLTTRTPQKTIDNLRSKLEAAGNPNNLTVADFLGLKGFSALVMVGAELLVLGNTDQEVVLKFVLGPIIALFVGWLLPDVWISGKVTTRQKELTLAMPDCLDLLTISVEAGMGFEQALQIVAEKWDNALTIEFRRVLREQRMGKSRREALRSLAIRCDTAELTTFTSAIIQGEQLGVSISRILQVQSDQMRIKRRQKAEKLAHEAPLKMTIPMVMFMMPALWIVILGPMWPNLAIMLGGK